MKKFDFVIGNPPYQKDTIGDNKSYAPPVYHMFLDEAFKISEKVELIHPARFLFNAGSTPKAWNEKMLNDKHFKILRYEEHSNIIFPDTDIKGGLVISYRDEKKCFGPIGVFTPNKNLNSILNRVIDNKTFQSFSTIVISSYAYHFNEKLYLDFPHLKNSLSDGHEYDLKLNVFEKMPEVFLKKNQKKEIILEF